MSSVCISSVCVVSVGMALKGTLMDIVQCVKFSIFGVPGQPPKNQAPDFLPILFL